MSSGAMMAITALLAIHIAGFAAWSGMLLAFLVLRVQDATRAGQLLQAALIAVIVTLAAGWGLAFAEHGSPDNWPWAVNAMQALGIAMTALLLVARFGALMLFEDAESRNDPEGIETAARRLQRLVAMNVLLCVITLAIAVTGRYG